MVGFGIGLSGFGAAQPEIRAQQDQQLKMQQIQQKKVAEAAIMQAMQRQRSGPPALPGSQPAPGGAPGAPPSAPGVAPASPGATGGGSPQGFAGGMPDLMTMMAALDKSGIPPDQQYEALTQYGAFASPFEKMQNQLTMAQQKMDMQQEMLKDRLGMMETIARMNNSTRERGQDMSSESKSGGGKPTLDDKSIDMLADQYLKTGKLPSGLGYRMTADKAAIIERAQQKGGDNPDLAAAGVNYKGEMSEAGSVGASGGRIKLAANSLDQSIPLARDAMKGVDLGKFTDLNAFQNYARSHTGDPGISRLNTALQTVITDYAAMISRTGQSTDQTRQAAKDLVNTSMAKGQMNAVFDQMSREKSAQMKAISQTKAGTTRGGEDSSQGGPVVLWDDLKE